MPELSQDVPALVNLLLPLKYDDVFAQEPGPEVVAAILGAFGAAVNHAVTPLNWGDRYHLCQRIAARDPGEFPVWMVEAMFRSAEGDDEAMVAADPEMAASIPSHTLAILCADFLNEDEAKALRSRATEIALEMLPAMQAAASRS
ncbi:hypothetical protein [Kineosporia babensis]|uniref:Uncharacterized protein n=1 Tax=Kineosporia babensis TaxID=499548 RepID=A0A9X1NGK9_9ACTN|nr:hypothetical protein [Kineosporia babensis]MCD5312723.1 hypothetical protein [Kineosporia babensis]